MQKLVLTASSTQFLWELLSSWTVLRYLILVLFIVFVAMFSDFILLS